MNPKETLERAARTFREYEAHHRAQAARLQGANPPRPEETADRLAKAARNAEMAAECEKAADELPTAAAYARVGHALFEIDLDPSGPGDEKMLRMNLALAIYPEGFVRGAG